MNMIELIPSVIANSFACSSVLVLAHVACERLLLGRRPHLSPQLVLIKLTVAGNFLALIGTLHIVSWQTRLCLQDQTFACAYSLLFFNCFAYAYFHFFNLSETGRRIHMLVRAAYPQLRHPTNSNGYSVNDMVGLRLKRLHSMGQITIGEAGNCQISGKTFLFIGVALRHLGELFVGNCRK